MNKGTEGWNCPSLFATALARKLTSSNNFVLQASSRCLRQIPGNTVKAKIYLSKDNVSILDRQLQETYGESLEDLNQVQTDMVTIPVTLKKVDIEPLLIKKLIQRVLPARPNSSQNIKVDKPTVKEIKEFEKVIYTMSIAQRRGVLVEIGTKTAKSIEREIDVYQAAVILAQVYRLDSLELFKLLSKIYPDGEITATELELARAQIEKQVVNYKVVTETVEEALALVKTKGFEEETTDGKTSFVTQIRVNKSSLEKYVLYLANYKKRSGQLLLFGFHYDPYNFDSGEERDFFERILHELGENPDDVEDIYFTGAVNDPAKTDFIFEYKDDKGEWHFYTPDFLIRKKNGKSLIVEVKAEKFRIKEAEREMKKLEKINPDKLKYELLLLEEGESVFGKVKPVIDWVYKGK